MREVRPVYDDEIDLIELFRIFWDGKWIIFAFAVLTTLAGFSYSQVAKPNYEISVPYEVNIYSVLSQQICETSNHNSKYWLASDCLADRTLTLALNELTGSWHLADRTATIWSETTSPLPLDDYRSMLSDAVKTTNNFIRDEAVSEIRLIESLSNRNGLATERVATNMLNSKRAIQWIDNGQSAINFGTISISQISPNIQFILILSTITGVLSGALFVCACHAIRKIKNYSAVTQKNIR